MTKDIIIKPVMSEKSDKLSSKSNKYTFIVDKEANKIQIGRAIKAMFPSVTVLDVNTAVIPGKLKTRNTRSGLVKGRVSSHKKAIVTLSPGDELEFYNN
jgi:large subunit ribosomal protein L23